jgi:DNA-binding HxlR family transcriptional regulator
MIDRNEDKKIDDHCPIDIGTRTCSEVCPYRKILSMISRKYTLDVLRVIMQNDVARFNTIVKEIGGSPKTITDRLKELCKAGILKRESYPEIPPHVEYSLTKKGKDLEPVMEKIMEWSDKWGRD